MIIQPIPPKAMPVSGLDDPRVFYQVLHDPAPLAGMSFPTGSPWGALESAGFRSVVCLAGNNAPYDPTPLQVLCAAKMKDLAGCLQPDDPEREAEILKSVVRFVVCELTAGRGAIVHCAGGTGRTGTVIACTLRSLGLSKDEVLNYMTTVNTVREKYPGWKGWPESDWQRRQLAGWVADAF